MDWDKYDSKTLHSSGKTGGQQVMELMQSFRSNKDIIERSWVTENTQQASQHEREALNTAELKNDKP